MRLHNSCSHFAGDKYAAKLNRDVPLFKSAGLFLTVYILPSFIVSNGLVTRLGPK